MYDTNWAQNFTGFDDGEYIDIQRFATFFARDIAEHNFTYQTENPQLPSFTVSVKANQLPHLMGLQHWMNVSVRQPEKQLEKLLSGEWTLAYLKAADNQAWKTYRERIEFLPYVYRLLFYADCSVRLTHSGIRSSFSNRRVDMFFRKDGDNLVYCLELRKISGDQVYVPTSLSTYRPKARDLQIPHRVLKVTRVTVRP